MKKAVELHYGIFSIQPFLSLTLTRGKKSRYLSLAVSVFTDLL